MELPRRVIAVLIAVFVSCLFLGNLQADEGDLRWVKQAGSLDLDWGFGMDSYSDGSGVVTGYFKGTAEFGPGQTLATYGNADIFIARYTGDGTLSWVRHAGGTGVDEGHGVASCPDGSVLVTGMFADTAFFGSTSPGDQWTSLTSAGSWDIFIARYNDDGTLDWAKRAGGAGIERSYAVASFSGGTSVITGIFEGTATFGPGEANETTFSTSTAFDYDVFVACYQPNGELAWARQTGGTGKDYGYGIASWSDGSCVVTGHVEMAGATYYDVFLVLYDAGGNAVWTKRAGGMDSDIGYDVDSCPDGSCVVTGKFEGTAFFGQTDGYWTTLTSAGGADIFVARYNADGFLSWAKRAGGAGNPEKGSGVAVNPDGSSAVTGSFRSTADFGPGEDNWTTLTSAGLQDVFIAGYNADGTLAWVRRAGSVSEDEGRGIAANPDGSCSVAGYFQNGAWFGQSEPNETYLETFGRQFYDIFIARFFGPKAYGMTDYDGDGTSDIGVFRPSSGLWAIRDVTRAYWGRNGDIPVPGDYNANGTTDIGAYRPSTGYWFIKDVTKVFWGKPNDDVPAAGDFDGDGSTDIGVYRQSSGLWAIRGVTRAYWGKAGENDEPLPGDYSGDGTANIGCYRPSTGYWFIKDLTKVFWGKPNDDLPAPGSYDAERKWKASVFRQSSGLWAVRGVSRAYWGRTGDIPVPGDYGGYGRDQIGAYRPSTGYWLIKDVTKVFWGKTGDVPVTR